MIYKHLGVNTTGQTLLGCPHVPQFVKVEMCRLTTGATLYEIAGLAGPILMLPSRVTIVFWCPDCYVSLKDVGLTPARIIKESESH